MFDNDCHLDGGSFDGRISPGVTLAFPEYVDRTGGLVGTDSLANLFFVGAGHLYSWRHGDYCRDGAAGEASADRRRADPLVSGRNGFLFASSNKGGGEPKN